MRLKQKITHLYAALLICNLLAWGLAIYLYAHHMTSLSLCLLAYSFGLRHGLDADHITAIDSVTRKLVTHDQPPIGVGVFFSLGHALVVVLLSLLVVLMTHSATHFFPALNTFGIWFGGLLAGIFLLLFAGINGFILLNLLRKHDFTPKGPLSTLFKPILNIVSKSWHMLFVGFLFGLGFGISLILIPA